MREIYLHGALLVYEQNVLLLLSHYIGTDLGVYVTLDAGKVWHSLSNSIPSCAVHDLVIQERELDLVAGTHGRSVFVLDIEGITP